MVNGSSNPQDTSASADNGPPEFPNKNINKQIAVVATLAAVGLFLSARLDLGVSLKDLSAAALPYEEVLCVKFVWSFIYCLFYLYMFVLRFTLIFGWCSRLFPMESLLLWSSTQIGAKCAGNWLRRFTKLSNNSSNNLQSLESYCFWVTILACYTLPVYLCASLMIIVGTGLI